MSSMKVDDMMLYKYKLSVMYAALGWFVFGLAVYSVTDSLTPKKQDSVDYVKLLGLKENTTMIKVAGLKQIKQEELKNETGISKNENLYDTQ